MASGDLAVVSEKGSSLTLMVKSAECTVSILRRTAFCFVRDCYVFMRRPDADHFEINLTPRQKPADKAVVSELHQRFEAELKDQLLRERLLKETAVVRQLVVGQALFAPEAESDPFAADFDFLDDDDDFLDDPLGIAVPWEEKFTPGEAGAETHNETGNADAKSDDTSTETEDDSSRGEQGSD